MSRKPVWEPHEVVVNSSLVFNWCVPPIDSFESLVGVVGKWWSNCVAGTQNLGGGDQVKGEKENL